MTEDGGNPAEPGGVRFPEKVPGRKTGIALALFGAVAVLAWRTMEPGRFRSLVFVVVGGLALRVVLSWRRSSGDTEAR